VISDDNLDWVCRLVRERTANQLTREKGYLVETRLAPLVRDAGHQRLDDFIAELRSRPGSAVNRLVTEALTINETSFFRDVSPFMALAERALPALIERRRSDRCIHLWSAACSTGQEPYSLALLIRERFPQLAGWTIRLIASDICARVLARARSGVYSQTEINRGLPARMLVRYFEPLEKGEWRLRDEIRELVDFRDLNLAMPWPAMPPLDLVLLRNVLIYFDDATRREVLKRVRSAMHPEGFLLLGASETPMFIDDQFEPMPGDVGTIYRIRGSRADVGAGGRPG
jgi:chemotaxis protein methyltransferase CheR